MEKVKMAFLGAGGISEKMALTIAKMPDVEAYAVAARDLDRAKDFAARHGFKKAYGSYKEMVEDPSVELVSVATPHSHHLEHSMLCLDHGKHVLCEKAFTVNAKQAKKLLDYAKEKKLLITEAIWTRYMPLSKKINEVLDSGIIGTPKLLTANLGYPISRVARIIEPGLAGGALLDLSVYPINFASMVFGDKVERVSSSALMTDKGVDATNSITMFFGQDRTAVMYSTIFMQTNREGIIYGDKGHIAVENINNPDYFRVFTADFKEIARYDAPERISGYEYEVQSAVKAIKEGRLECPEMPHRETLRIMELLDDIRSSWGMKFPFEKD
ncbi:MAG: Gfo/Idh/MocA family oxidoreductase [Treponema sp.]|jgi:predicted dehydrogenase|nr:Gfo/Idh/MocA family oxidoreductase [Treponema sp.]